MAHPIVEHLENLADPRLAVYANLKDAQLRRAESAGERGVFIAEGPLTVEQLLKSRFPVVSLLCTPEGLERVRPLLSQRDEPAAVYVVPQAAIESITGFGFHRGVLACGRRLEQPPLETLLETATSLTILEGITNHDNVGGMFRCVGALGGDRPAVLLSPNCCDPFYRKSLRMSVGQVLHVPFAKLEDWPGALAQVRDAGWTILAFTPAPDAPTLETIALNAIARPAVLLGAEGPGLTPPALALAHHQVRIPMRPGVDSLNVFVAGAIALSRLVRPG